MTEKEKLNDRILNNKDLKFFSFDIRKPCIATREEICKEINNFYALVDQGLATKIDDWDDGKGLPISEKIYT